MDRIFYTRTFGRWLQKSGLSNSALGKALEEMASGLVDADLGGNLYKKRVALPGQGKRGGSRIIVASKMDGKWFLLYGFAKNEQGNITATETRALKMLASDFLLLNEIQLTLVLQAGELIEVNHETKEK
jgi:hypothetical protein